MIRLIILVVLLLVSLLAILKAPAYYLWILAIAVTEYPLIFAGITAFVTLSGFWVQKFQLAGTIFGILTIAIFLSPVFRAYALAGKLKNEMSAVFRTEKDHSEQAFDFWRLFSGIGAVRYNTITYVKYPGISLDLDFYPAQAAGKRPCVIVIHGGSWSSGDSRQLPELNSYLARTGYSVAAINYRMAPRYRYPAPVEDVKAALSYLVKHAVELHIDTTRFV